MKPALLALLALSLAACGREATTALDSRPDPSFASTTDRGPAAEGLLVPGWNRFRCFDAPAQSKWDPDGDTMDNRCEDALAAAFAPGLRAAGDCNYDPGVGRQGGEYYYGVQPYWYRSSESAPLEPRARLAYLPAYYWDCGSPTGGGQPFGDGHDGDSEFFIVDVQFNDTTRHWVTQQIFLSAHCGTPTSQRCMWYPDPTTTTVTPTGTAQPFSWVDGKVRGAPVIWVAEGKGLRRGRARRLGHVRPERSVLSLPGSLHTAEHLVPRDPAASLRRRVAVGEHPCGAWRHGMLLAAAHVLRLAGPLPHRLDGLFGHPGAVRRLVARGPCSPLRLSLNGSIDQLHVDHIHARLAPIPIGSCEPRPLPQRDLRQTVHGEAAPVVRRARDDRPARALAGELIAQAVPLAPLRAEYVWTERPREPVVNRPHLPTLEDRLPQ